MPSFLSSLVEWGHEENELIHYHLRLHPYLLRNAFMRQLQINKYFGTLPTGQVTGKYRSFLLYMDMLNVSHASPALQGHYEHLLGTIYREPQHV